MTATERRAAVSLAAIYGMRMLGLFLILPVFALFAEGLPDATPVLIGLAIGVYGLTQALLQIPFGMLSDRIGRKPVIIGGLLLFAAGGVIAASAEDIVWIIIGRALQGSGAIAAAVMALAADLTRDSQRTKAMAMIGVTIGASFLLALILGPSLNPVIGVSGLFWLTALLALAGVLIVAFLVPSPSVSSYHADAEPAPRMLGQVLRIPELLRLDVGIFTLHLVLTSVFLVVPLALRDAGLAPAQHGWMYLGVMLVAIAGMLPLMYLSERRGQTKPVFLGAIAAIGATQAIFATLGDHLTGWIATLVAFFIAFNLLEATLPSLVSRTAPPRSKGTAIGVYSTSQFAGAFVGGLLGGWLHGRFGAGAVFIGGSLLAVIWLAAASGMRPPARSRDRLLNVGPVSAEQALELGRRLGKVNGVREAVVVAEEGVAYLKVEPDQLDADALDAFRAAES